MDDALLLIVRIPAHSAKQEDKPNRKGTKDKEGKRVFFVNSSCPSCLCG
jgi:hypothetical protein